MSAFRKEIESAINRACKENDSNTPDFILANFLCNCLDAFTLATKSRDRWYSVHLEPCNSHFIKDAPQEIKETGGTCPQQAKPKITPRDTESYIQGINEAHKRTGNSKLRFGA